MHFHYAVELLKNPHIIANLTHFRRSLERLKNSHILTNFIFDSRCPVSQGGQCVKSNQSQTKCQSAAEQYWERFVLEIHKAPTYKAEDGNTTAFPSFGEIGEIKWDLSLCLLGRESQYEW